MRTVGCPSPLEEDGSYASRLAALLGAEQQGEVFLCDVGGHGVYGVRGHGALLSSASTCQIGSLRSCFRGLEGHRVSLIHQLVKIRPGEQLPFTLLTAPR